MPIHEGKRELGPPTSYAQNPTVTASIHELGNPPFLSNRIATDTERKVKTDIKEYNQQSVAEMDILFRKKVVDKKLFSSPGWNMENKRVLRNLGC